MIRSPAVLFGLLLLALAIGIFGTWPAWQDFSALRKELRQKQSVFETQEQYISNIQAASQKLQTFPNELAVLDSAIPQKPNLASLYDLAADLAAVSGLSVRSISSISSRTEPFPDLTTIDAAVVVAGSYAALKEFLANVASSPRFLQVESLSFGTLQEGAVNYQIRLSAFSY